MSELNRRLGKVRNGTRPDWASTSDVWFAIYPVRLGALGTGRIAFLEYVWRNRCLGVTIYQDLETAGLNKSGALVPPRRA